MAAMERARDALTKALTTEKLDGVTIVGPAQCSVLGCRIDVVYDSPDAFLKFERGKFHQAGSPFEEWRWGNGRTALLRNNLRADAVFATLRSRVKLGEGGSVEALEALDRLDDICRERRRIFEQQRVYHWLHGWLMIHIPLSVALLVLGIAHAVMATLIY